MPMYYFREINDDLGWFSEFAKTNLLDMVCIILKAYYTTTYLAQNRMEINFVRNVSLTPMCSCTNMYNVEKK